MPHRWCPSLRPLKLLGSKEERKVIMQKHMLPAINDPSAARTWDVVVTSYEGVSAAGDRWLLLGEGRREKASCGSRTVFTDSQSALRVAQNGLRQKNALR